ncbi:4497_t:CDS:2, partial [Ambispora leptoticha]
MTALLWQQGIAGYQLWDFGTHQLGRPTNDRYLTGCNAPNISAFQINIPVALVFWDPPIPSVAGYTPVVPLEITAVNFNIDLYRVQQ